MHCNSIKLYNLQLESIYISNKILFSYRFTFFLHQYDS